VFVEDIVSVEFYFLPPISLMRLITSTGSIRKVKNIYTKQSIKTQNPEDKSIT